MQPLSKKEWLQPQILFLHSNIIESGALPYGRFEQIKSLALSGCGKAGTVVGTMVNWNQEVSICYDVGQACNRTPFALSAGGNLGTSTRASYGLCS